MIATERVYRWLRNATFNEADGCSHPLDVIAAAVGCTERTVIRAVQQLERDGRLRVHRPRVRGQCNTYWVDHWAPSKRVPVLKVLAAVRPEVQRRRAIKCEREAKRIARNRRVRAPECHPKENSRPARAQTLAPGPSDRASFVRCKKRSTSAVVARASNSAERSPSEMNERYAAIGWLIRDEDGPSFGWDHAKVQCAECDGWEGTTCPHGCGVRLVSTEAEHAAAFRERMRREEAERRERREQRRRERAARTGDKEAT